MINENTKTNNQLYLTVEELDNNNNRQLRLSNCYRSYLIDNISNELLEVIKQYTKEFGNTNFKIEMTSVNHCYLIFNKGTPLQIPLNLAYELSSKMILLNITLKSVNNID